MKTDTNVLLPKVGDRIYFQGRGLPRSRGTVRQVWLALDETAIDVLPDGGVTDSDVVTIIPAFGDGWEPAP